MKTNVGKVDQIFRVTVGPIICILSLYSKKWWGVLLGIILIIEGIIRYCPLNDLLGISTNKIKNLV